MALDTGVLQAAYQGTLTHEDGPYSNSEMGCLPRVKARCVTCRQQLVFCCPSTETFRRMRTVGFVCTPCRA